VCCFILSVRHARYLPSVWSHICLVRAAGRRGRLAAAILHRCLGFAVQRAVVHIEDVAVTYAQEGEPGPRPSGGGHLAERDAVTLRLRTLDLQPQGEQLTSLQGFRNAGLYGVQLLRRRDRSTGHAEMCHGKRLVSKATCAGFLNVHACVLQAQRVLQHRTAQ